MIQFLKLICHMCKIMEDFAKEEREEERIELALKNLQDRILAESQSRDFGRPPYFLEDYDKFFDEGIIP